MNDPRLPLEEVLPAKAKPGETAVVRHDDHVGRVYTREPHVVKWVLASIEKAKVERDSPAGQIVSFPVRYVPAVRDALGFTPEPDLGVGL